MVTSSRRNGGSSPHEGKHCITHACDAELFPGSCPSNNGFFEVAKRTTEYHVAAVVAVHWRPPAVRWCPMVCGAGDSRDQFYRPHIGHPTAGIRATLESMCVSVWHRHRVFGRGSAGGGGFAMSYWITSRRPRAGQKLELEPAAQDDLICDAGVVRGPDGGLKW